MMERKEEEEAKCQVMARDRTVAEYVILSEWRIDRYAVLRIEVKEEEKKKRTKVCFSFLSFRPLSRRHLSSQLTGNASAHSQLAPARSPVRKLHLSGECPHSKS